MDYVPTFEAKTGSQTGSRIHARHGVQSAGSHRVSRTRTSCVHCARPCCSVPSSASISEAQPCSWSKRTACVKACMSAKLCFKSHVTRNPAPVGRPQIAPDYRCGACGPSPGASSKTARRNTARSSRIHVVNRTSNFRAWRHNIAYVYNHVLEGGTIPERFAERRTVLIPKTSDIDDNGRIIRSPEAQRPLTLCNCDCKLLCRGLHWYTMRCIQPSQRCISSRQMTDNIFETEATALAHVACAPQE